MEWLVRFGAVVAWMAGHHLHMSKTQGEKMFGDLFNALTGAPASVFEVVGEVVALVGEVTENETLKEIGEAIKDNSEVLSK
jgi:hypothetical protein